MFDLLTKLAPPWFRRAESTLSIPILDGALKPNQLLEEAPVFAERAGLEDLALGPNGELYAACGHAVVAVSNAGVLTELASFERPVTAIAACADGTLVAALGHSVVIDIESASPRQFATVDGRALTAVNALHAAADGSLLIADGSSTRHCGQWSHDLLEKGHTGRLLQHDRQSDLGRTLAANLAYCFGACADGEGGAIASESWRHRLVRVEDGATAQAASVLGGLPGYPARIAPAEGGGFWLNVFACRTQLVEFVLREDDYRQEMMRTIEPRHWVAPAFSSGDDFLEPLQGGSVKQMGILKPWAPPRSYGLVVRLGADFVPRYSLHSRVGGRHHGVVATVQRGDELFVLAKGAGRILRLSVAEASQGVGA